MEHRSEPRRKTVIAIASQGGHWVQLRRMREAWAGCRVIYVTTQEGYRAEVMATEPDAGFLTVPDASRWDKLRLLRSAAQIAWILLRYRPDAVVTTGAAPGYFAIRIGHLLGARAIWVDSIANCDMLSMSGEKAGPHSDLWLTQWPHLARKGKSLHPGPGYRGATI